MKWYLLLVCLLRALQAQDYAYFIPPQKWDMIYDAPSPLVKITFVGKAKKNCRPLINLATEQVDISLKEYVAIVKKNCEKDPHHQKWQDLGNFSTQAGEARLIKTLYSTAGNTLARLQLMLLKNGTIYVLTTSCLQEHFIEFSKEFYKSLKSFTITSDLIEDIQEKESQEELKTLCSQILKNSKPSSALFADKKFQKETWQPFTKIILNNYPNMGNYWKILLLQDIKDKLTKDNI